MEYAEVFLVAGHGYSASAPIQLVKNTNVVVTD